MRFVSWEEVHEMSLAIARKFKGSIDAVIGILRGGYFPAHLVADALGVEVFVVRFKSYSGTEKRGMPKVVLPLIGDVSGMRVLVVDDVCDTGDTLKAAKELLRLYSPKEVKTATLFLKPRCEERPDFWVEETEEWVAFPWDAFELLRERPSTKRSLEAKLGVKLDLLGKGEGPGNA